MPTFDNKSEHLHLANHSLNQLNIVDTSFSKGSYSSVEKLVNKCVTPMGSRHLKKNFYIRLQILIIYKNNMILWNIL